MQAFLNLFMAFARFAVAFFLLMLTALSKADALLRTTDVGEGSSNGNGVVQVRRHTSTRSRRSASPTRRPRPRQGGETTSNLVSAQQAEVKIEIEFDAETVRAKKLLGTASAPRRQITTIAPQAHARTKMAARISSVKVVPKAVKTTAVASANLPFEKKRVRGARAAQTPSLYDVPIVSAGACQGRAPPPQSSGSMKRRAEDDADASHFVITTHSTEATSTATAIAVEQGLEAPAGPCDRLGTQAPVPAPVPAPALAPASATATVEPALPTLLGRRGQGRSDSLRMGDFDEGPWAKLLLLPQKQKQDQAHQQQKPPQPQQQSAQPQLAQQLVLVEMDVDDVDDVDMEPQTPSSAMDVDEEREACEMDVCDVDMDEV